MGVRGCISCIPNLRKTPICRVWRFTTAYMTLRQKPFRWQWQATLLRSRWLGVCTNKHSIVPRLFAFLASLWRRKSFLFLRFIGYTQICPRAARRQRNLCRLNRFWNELRKFLLLIKNDMAKVAEVAKKWHDRIDRIDSLGRNGQKGQNGQNKNLYSGFNEFRMIVQ